MNNLREKIDFIDNEILSLLEKRMQSVLEIGKIKNKKNSNIYVPTREREILDRLKSQKDILKDVMIDRIFLEIFSASRALENDSNIAYLGPIGSFTHQSALNQFGQSANFMSFSNIDSLFVAIKNNQCKYAIVPIENSTSGIVNQTIQSFLKYQGISIIAENSMKIHHTLASKCSCVDEIDTIYSKDIAFMQCQNFLNNLSLSRDSVKFVEVDSTSTAAKLASENENSAAICSLAGAKIYSLAVMYENIEDNKSNETRFFTISSHTTTKCVNSKTSILVNVTNQTGILYKILESFYKQNIDLTNIKSHISDAKSSFFLEFLGHFEDEEIQKIIQEQRAKNIDIKILGSYERRCNDI